ncbi:MAG: HigA family addiction module antidote protein [Heliobacteriaceae bacterium]|jgi:addiction module HigA family antidote|nr:HigA family addiction module antidote protein [Heliobacteriaceae bacterium]
MDMYNPAHPGEILKEGYLDELNISIAAAALKLGVSRKTLYDLINGKSAVSSEMALKIAKAFNSDATFWLDLQTQYDLWHARQRVDLSKVQVMYGK